MDQEILTSGQNISKNLKTKCGDYFLNLDLDKYSRKLKIQLQNVENKNKYQLILDEGKLSQDLKAYLVDIEYIYEYFQENTNNKQKLSIDQKGKIKLAFVLQISAKKQINKQIMLQTQLTQVGKAEIQDSGMAMSQQINKIKQQLQEYKKSQQAERKKTNVLVSSLQKTNQRIIIQSQSLKFQNLNLKNKVTQMQQKYVNLETVMKQLINATEQIKLETSTFKKQLQQSKIINVQQLKEDDTFIKMVSSFIKQNDGVNSEQIIHSKIKSLQIQVAQQNKLFQQKLTYSQKKIQKKLQELQKQYRVNNFQLYKQVEQINNKLQDNQIELIKSTVKKVNTMFEEGNQMMPSQKSIIQRMSKSSINLNGHKAKIGTTGKFYCGGKLQGKKCKCCDGGCGPTNGQNCLICMKLDIQRRGLKKGFLVNANGQIAWKQKDRMRCGIGNGKSNCGQNGQYCYFCQRLNDSVKDRYSTLL